MLRGRGMILASVLWLAFTAACIAEEIDVKLRFAWAGPPHSWSGTIELSEGTILGVSPLGLEADAPGSLQIANRTTIRVLPRVPRSYDACDLHVRIDPAATIKVRLNHNAKQPRAVDVPVAKILQGLESHALEDDGSRFLAQRSPGDALRVELDRPSLVFVPDVKFPFRVLPNHAQLPPNTTISLHVQLTAARSDTELESFTRDIKTDARGEATAEKLEIELPQQEGVYDVRLSLQSKRYAASLLRQRAFAERRIQVVVLAVNEPALGTSRAAQSESEIDPATP